MLPEYLAMIADEVRVADNVVALLSILRG